MKLKLRKLRLFKLLKFTDITDCLMDWISSGCPHTETDDYCIDIHVNARSPVNDMSYVMLTFSWVVQPIV